MMNPELLNYTLQRRGQGVPDNIIREELLSAGWPRGKIAAVFNTESTRSSLAPARIKPSLRSQIIAGVILAITLVLITYLVASVLEPLLSEQTLEGLKVEDLQTMVNYVIFVAVIFSGIVSTRFITGKLDLKPKIWSALNIFVIADYLTLLVSSLAPNPVLVTISAVMASILAVMGITYVSYLNNRIMTIATTGLCLIGMLLIYIGIG